MAEQTTGPGPEAAPGPQDGFLQQEKFRLMGALFPQMVQET